MPKPDNKGGFFKNAYQLRNVEETREFYAQWAETYDQEIGIDGGYRQPERCAEALANAIDNRNLPILDIGCGTGLSGLALREKAFQQIDGCDLSAPMLEIAKQCGCYRHLFETDLNQPPINVDPHTYAGISAVGVFSFGHVAPDAMDEFLRVLVPGGKFVVGINDHYYSQGDFTAKLKSLKSAGLIRLLSEEHGVHLKNIEGSTGWVIVCEKISEK